MQVENYARAFPDMHRELYQLYVSGNIVVVQLALQGTHLGPLDFPGGTLLPTGNRMDAPCCDVFELRTQQWLNTVAAASAALPGARQPGTSGRRVR